MITPKIKALFDFVEYLHLNIDKLVQLNTDFVELQAIKSKLGKTNIKDRTLLTLSFNEKFELIENTFNNLIVFKVEELSICDFKIIEKGHSSGAKSNTILIRNKKAIDNFIFITYSDDVNEVFKYKKMFYKVYYSLDYEYYFKHFFDYLKHALDLIFEAFEKTQTEIQQFQNQSIIREIKPIKYKANEYALAYIFDLWANNQQVPQNRVEGGLNSKEIKKIGGEIGFDKPDTFYRAVKSLLVYDLNKPSDLQNISKDWFNAVRNLSTNWVTTEQYLKDKKLIEE